MGKKILLLAIAVVAVGLFILPQTMALFAGQHTFYNGSGVDCEKCHADIADEMNSLVSAHTGETGYGRFKCEYCHRVFNLTDWGGAPSQNVNQTIYKKYYYTGKKAHAASTVPCLYCHSGEDVGSYHPSTFTGKACSCHGSDDGGSDYYYHGDRFYTGTSDTDPGECIRCHGTGPPMYIPPARGFNLTASSTDTGSLAAHKKFVDDAISNPDMEDANEACIACHTSVGVNITWTRNTVLNFTASENETGTWDLTNFQAKGSNTTETSYPNNYTGGY